MSKDFDFRLDWWEPMGSSYDRIQQKQQLNLHKWFRRTIFCSYLRRHIMQFSSYFGGALYEFTTLPKFFWMSRIKVLTFSRKRNWIVHIFVKIIWLMSNFKTKVTTSKHFFLQSAIFSKLLEIWENYTKQKCSPDHIL